MKQLLKQSIFIIFQLFIFGSSFILYTSTMEVFPWYDSCGSGTFLILLLILPLQMLSSLIIWGFRKELSFDSGSGIISNINLGFLIFNLIIIMKYDKYFIPISNVSGIIVCLLAISFLVTIFRPLVGKQVGKI